MSLRPYQIDSLDQIKAGWLHGHRNMLLWLATGAGKTIVFCEAIKRTVAAGKKVLVVVRGRKLVDQAHQRLFREGVEHGVIMAGHYNQRLHLPVQVCSIDTLLARDQLPKADLIIIDECDQFGPDTEAATLIAKYPFARILAVTATPYVKGGLRHIADAICHPITTQELVDQGYLVPFRYFAPSEPDLKGVQVSRGDYNNRELEKRMVANQLSGDIVNHWLALAKGVPTLGFAVNIHHSRLLVEKFVAAGVAAEHCDADTKDKDREAIIKRLESGKTQVVFNVGIFCRGVDIPCVGALIGARPTKSRNLHIQIMGRGTRLHPGKESCLLLDHAGNIRRHGFYTMEPSVDLDGTVTEEKGALEVKTCKKCFCCYRGVACPECGQAPVKPEPKKYMETEEELKEIILTSKNPVEQYLEWLTRSRAESGRKQAWIYYKLLEQFTEEQCKPHIPQWFWKLRGGMLPGDLGGFASSPYKGIGQ